jgi:ATP-dependent exoDNAse (exonuclease V) beta subunit
MKSDGKENRGLIRTNLDDTMVVEAAAGTGKTTELVARIVAIIESGRATIGQIVAVTFSEKAAGELKLRLREELERARGRHTSKAPELERLSAAAYDFEEAQVSTIHGFCAELLRERPVEARVDPAFAVLTDNEAGRYFNEAFAEWLHEQLQARPEGVRRSLRRPVGWRPDDEDDNGPIERLRRAASELREWRDHAAPWKRPDYSRKSAIDALALQLREFSAMTSRPLKKGDNLSVDTRAARALSEEIERQRRMVGNDADYTETIYDGWEARLVALADDRKFNKDVRRGSGTAFAAGVSREQALAAYAALLQALGAFRDVANADLAALLHEEMRSCLDRYEQRKQAAGAVDFLDLLIKARDLVRDDKDVRDEFRRRFRVLLVDEFQDTDPVQADLLLLLAGQDTGKRIRPGALFIVGDPKQSIYRFRRADVGAYRRISDELDAHGATPVTLQTSFRSVPAIQRFVNAAFREGMTGDRESLQANYVPLNASRAEHPSQPAVVALPIARPYGARQVTQMALNAGQPAAIGEFVKWMLSADCSWTVDDRGERRKIVAKHICLLFRRFLHFGEDITRDYVEAFEARGVPHLLVGGKTFHAREEVDAVRTALTAIEWPEDELSVYSTLHGPLFAIGEEELFEYHSLARVFHPYRIPSGLPDRLAPVAAALTTLKELHSARNYRPVADTIGRLIQVTRAHAGFILWRGGEQVLANVLHIGDLARQYESEGGLSFRGFVDMLHDASGRGDAPEAPILEEGSEGVRMMTVHKAKGLEFPVVILADMTCKLSLEHASRHLDSSRGLCAVKIGGWSPVDLLEHNAVEAKRDEAEGVRLAYVAATRARDVLVVPAVGDGPYQNGWLRPLNHALYPPVDRWQTATPARGCPLFKGKATVLEGPGGQPPMGAMVRPGAYEMVDPETKGAYTVVWWDPLLLGGQAEDPRGLRREELITKDAKPAEVAADRAKYEEWRAERGRLQSAGAQPSIKVTTVTEWSQEDSVGDGWRAGALAPADIVIEQVAGPSLRPSGKRFGTLVHVLLASAPLAATREEVDELARLHARLLVAPDEERDVAAAITHQALQHPRLMDARSAKQVAREVPVSMMIGSEIVDGQIDLAYETADGWVVVDFKSDIEIAGGGDTYRRQVAFYAAAITKATGQPARGILLRI